MPSTVLAPVALLLSAPAGGPGVAPDDAATTAIPANVDVQDERAKPDETDVDHLNIPGYDGAASGFSLELGIAPELVSHNALQPGSQTSDTLDLSLVFAATQQIARDVEVEFDAGITKTIDNDDGSFSELAATIELRSLPGSSGFSTFVSYNIAREYADFFDNGLDTEHTVTGGVRYGHSIGPAEIGFELAPRWMNSSNDRDDQIAVNLWGEAVVPLIGEGIVLIADVSLERRWYANTDPVLLAKRRDWRLANYVGLDFAGAINASLGGNFIRTLGVGGEWLKVGSNFDDADRSDLSFLPAVKVGVSF